MFWFVLFIIACLIRALISISSDDLEMQDEKRFGFILTLISTIFIFGIGVIIANIVPIYGWILAIVLYILSPKIAIKTLRILFNKD